MDKLARDVFVNVLANLIAAAVLYLLAVGAGALPQNSDLQLIASTSVVAVLSGWAFADLMRRFGRQRLGALILLLPGGCYVVLSGAVFPNPTRPWWLSIGYAIAGGLFLLLGLWLALRYDQRGRHTHRHLSASNPGADAR